MLGFESCMPFSKLSVFSLWGKFLIRVVRATRGVVCVFIVVIGACRYTWLRIWACIHNVITEDIPNYIVVCDLYAYGSGINAQLKAAA